MNEEQLIKRKDELFAPIHQQILMTDDNNDLLLLSLNMFTTSIDIMCNHYGNKDGMHLIEHMLDLRKRICKN
jgi:hypothetical protein